MIETTQTLVPLFKELDSLDTRDVLRAADELREVIIANDCATILDYGSGDGKAWFVDKLDEQIGVNLSDVFLYDPAIERYSDLPSPNQTFDGVILFNVLQCCPEEEVDEILESVIPVAKRFIHVSVDTTSSKTFLSSGENTNVLIRSPQWWKKKLGRYRLKHNNIQWRITINVGV